MKRDIQPRGLVALVVPALALAAGCIPPHIAADPSSVPICLARHEKPWTAPEFIAAGNEARDRALSYENARLLWPPVGAGVFGATWTVELREASDCYERALLTNPSSYSAQLGLGTVYLLVGLRSRNDKTATNPFFAHAKQHLGRAYFLRAEKNEPVLYLALIAVAENQLPTAQYLLGYLQRNRPNDGEVLTLTGYYAERSGNPIAAKQYYSMAFSKGASADTLTFLTNWLRSHP